MTSHVGRLYAIALALFVFFVVWAGVAARPWSSSTPSAQLQVLAVREQALRREAALVHQIVSLRAKTASAPVAAVASGAAPPPQPAVRVVHLPPLTITRTS